MIKREQPDSFAVFCKNCGSYEIDVYSLNIDDVYFYCEVCDIEESIG